MEKHEQGLAVAQILARHQETAPYVFQCLSKDPESVGFVVGCIRDNAANFELQYLINLDEYTQLRDLGFRVPPEVEMTIGYMRGLARGGFAFETTYHNAKFDLMHNTADYVDPALQAAFEAAREKAQNEEAETGVDILRQYDLDRE